MFFNIVNLTKPPEASHMEGIELLSKVRHTQSMSPNTQRITDSQSKGLVRCRQIKFKENVS